MVHPYPRTSISGALHRQDYDAYTHITTTKLSKSTCWLSAWSTQVSTMIDYHCGIKVEPFIFYFNIPWATSSYTLHHSSANNGGPAFFLWGIHQYTINIWGTSLIDSDINSQQCSYDPPFPNNGTLTDCSQLYQRWGMMRILVLPWSKSARSWASRELDHYYRS